MTSRRLNFVKCSMEQQLARMESKMESGIVFSNNAGSNGSAGNQAERDESWVKDPAVEVVWFDRPGFADDPRGSDDYRIGGTFTETFEAQPRKLTPILGEDVYGRRVQDQVCERLAEFNPETLELEGWLAEAWQYDPEGYWIRVKIRDVARFSDGRPVTAEDVRWTFHDYINNPACNCLHSWYERQETASLMPQSYGQIKPIIQIASRSRYQQ